MIIRAKLLRAGFGLAVLAILLPFPAALAEGPTELELSSAEHYVEQFEFDTAAAEGKPFTIGYTGKRAMEEVKSLVERFPDHPKVKELFERVRVCVKKSRGSVMEITEEMLAYRKLEQILSEKLGAVAEAEWAEYMKELEESPRYLPQPFPAPEPGEPGAESQMLHRRVVLPGFEFPGREFTNSGRQFVHVGSVTQGLYYVALSNRAWIGAYEALKRYRREATGDLPPSWTIVGKVTGYEVLVPRTGEAGASELARPGWIVQLEAIYLPGRAFAHPDPSHPRGGTFSGEILLAELKAPFLTQKEVPKEVEPKGLVEIYIAAVKEKNFDLFLECVDPDLRDTPLARESLRQFWDVNQRNFAEEFVHVAVSKVGEPVAIAGEKLDGSLDSFFLDDEEKKEILARADALVEEIHVTVRRFDEKGKQVGTPRDVILRRYKEGRWYVRNGLVL